MNLKQFKRHEDKMAALGELHKTMGRKKKIVEEDIEIPSYLNDEVTPALNNLLEYLKNEIREDIKSLDKAGDLTYPRCYKICKFFCSP